MTKFLIILNTEHEQMKTQTLPLYYRSIITVVSVPVPASSTCIQIQINW